MKLSLKMLFSAALTVLVQCSFAADVVQIRKVNRVPFYSNGKRIEAVWKNTSVKPSETTPQTGCFCRWLIIISLIVIVIPLNCNIIL